MSRCLECNGRGFAITPITGRMAGICRSCKGSGCPMLGRLICTGTGHPHGHTYQSSSVADGHTTSEEAAEATR